MKPLDKWKARRGALSESTVNIIRACSDGGAKCLDAMPYFFQVWEAAQKLCEALARGEMAYERQGEREKLLAEVPK